MMGVVVVSTLGCSASPSGGVCCPVGDLRRCGCQYVGGFAESMAGCFQECDGADYTAETDEHGCEVHRSHGSCLEHTDVGPRDAPDAPFDVPPTDAGGGVCCPTAVFPGLCGCFHIGGWAESESSCPQECDGADYTEETDGFGCPIMVAHGSCLGRDAGLPDAPDVSTP